jgi:ketosteroid isomerase-like protein
MASGNLDLVRSVYAAWERGDWSSVEWADPEIEFVFADGPLPGSSTGRAAMSDAWRDFLGNWEDWRIVVEEYRELDDARVLVLVRNTGRGKRSGVMVEQIASKAANLLHIRDGRVVRLIAYADRDRAFADLGLAPEADSPGRAANLA